MSMLNQFSLLIDVTVLFVLVGIWYEVRYFNRNIAHSTEVIADTMVALKRQEEKEELWTS